MGVPKTVASGTNQSRVADGPRIGRAPRQYGGRTPRTLLWPCGTGVFVAEPCLPSGDAPGNIVEYCTTAARIAAPHHYESSGAPGEDAAVKSPQSSLSSRFRPMRC